VSSNELAFSSVQLDRACQTVDLAIGIQQSFSTGRWDLDVQETKIRQLEAKGRWDLAGGVIGSAGHVIWEKQPVGLRIAIEWGKFSARDLKRERGHESG
jgi:hypothetical protein